AGGRRADADHRVARHSGDEILIVACLDDGFLIVDRRNPWARQHTRLTLGCQQFDVSVEAAGVDGERKRTAERVGEHTGHGVAGAYRHRDRGLIQQLQVIAAESLLWSGLETADGTVPLLRDGGPVDAGAEGAR